MRHAQQPADFKNSYYSTTKLNLKLDWYPIRDYEVTTVSKKKDERQLIGIPYDRNPVIFYESTNFIIK